MTSPWPSFTLAYSCKRAFTILYRSSTINIPAQEVREWSKTGNKNGGRPVLNGCWRSGKKQEERLQGQNKLASFEEAVLSHLDAAYNLARWLTHIDTDAEDVVQEAYLRAFRFFGGFHGADGRSWLLAIVRNSCYTWMQHNRSSELTISLDDDLHEIESKDLNPEALLLQSADSQMVRQALQELPVEFREVVVLRELEGLSYKQIAAVVEIPVGTVMSRLARARKHLQQILKSHWNKDTAEEVMVGGS